MAKDFRASQIRGTKWVASGSNVGLSSDSQPSALIISASTATNDTGAHHSDLLTDVGGDVFLFVSGTLNTGVDGWRTRRDVALFGGDVVISGTLYAEKQILEVDYSQNSHLYMSGGLFLGDQGAASTDDGNTGMNAGTNSGSIWFATGSLYARSTTDGSVYYEGAVSPIKAGAGLAESMTGVVKTLTMNIDSLVDGTGLTVATTDKLAISDSGAEKYINVSDLQSVFLRSDTDDTAAGSLTMANTKDILAATGGGSDLGSTSSPWGDIFLLDDKKVQFGTSQDMTFGYVGGSDTLHIENSTAIINIKSTGASNNAVKLRLLADADADALDGWEIQNEGSTGGLKFICDANVAGTFDHTIFTLTGHNTVQSSIVEAAGILKSDSLQIGGGFGSTGVTIENDGNILSDGRLKISSLGFTDGDLAMTIADGGPVTFASSVTVGGALIGPSNSDLSIRSDGNITFVLDDDNDETSQAFSFMNDTTEIANLNESGGLQIDGNLTVSGNNIAGSSGTVITFDSATGTDIKTFITGTTGTRGTGTRGMTVFAGDVLLSGSLFFETGNSLPTFIAENGTFSGMAATGTDSVAMMDNAAASGDRSLAIGDSSVASGEEALAIGKNAKASGANSVVIGSDDAANQQVASGQYSAVLGGYRGTASGDYSITAGGASNVASGNYAVAIGQGNSATATNAIAIGRGAVAKDADSIAIGNVSGNAKIVASGSLEVISTSMFTQDVTIGEGADLFVPGYIKHKGDTNTYVRFNGDRIRLAAGGVNQFDMNAERVLILSGGDSESYNEANGQDVAFYVSGSTSSQGTAVRGTALFGGDLYVSGAFAGPTAINFSDTISVYKDGADLKFDDGNNTVKTLSDLASVAVGHDSFEAAGAGSGYPNMKLRTTASLRISDDLGYAGEVSGVGGDVLVSLGVNGTAKDAHTKGVVLTEGHHVVSGSIYALDDLIVSDFTRTAGLRVGTTSTDPGNGNIWAEGDIIAGGNLIHDSTETTVLRFDSGKVSIGSSAVPPVAPVHVQRTGNTTAASSNELEHFLLLLKNTSNTQNAFAGIAFDVSSETDADSIGAAIRAERDDNGGTSANHDANLTFSTNAGGGTADDALTERMRITKSGNLGVGVTDPDSKLEILSTGTQLKLSYDSVASSSFTVASDGDTTWQTHDAIIDAAGNIELNANGGSILFKDDASQLASIDSSGAMALGGALTVSGNSIRDAGAQVFQFDGSGNVSNNPDFNGHIQVADSIRHLGDTTTAVAFGASIIALQPGGVNFLKLHNTTQDLIDINTNKGDINFRIRAASAASNGTPAHGQFSVEDAMFVKSSTGQTAFGTSTMQTDSRVLVNGALTTLDPYSSKVYFKLTGSSDDAILDMYANNGVVNKIHANGISYFNGGNVGIGVTDADTKLEVLSTSTQLKLSYDAGSFATISVADASGTTIATGESGALTLDSGGAINIDPHAGSAIVLDSTINIDAGVVTGATSITSTAFVGALTGNASTSTLAVTVTVSDDSTTDTAFPVAFHNGSNGLKDDTGVFTYNPNSETLTAPVISAGVELKAQQISYTDGDDAIKILDGGAVKYDTGVVGNPAAEVAVIGNNTDYWTKIIAGTYDNFSDTFAGTYLVTISGNEHSTSYDQDSTFFVHYKYTPDNSDPWYHSEGTHVEVELVGPMSDLNSWDPSTDIAITFENDSTPNHEIWIKSKGGFKSITAVCIGGSRTGSTYSTECGLVQTGQTAVSSIATLGTIVYGTWGSKILEKLTVSTSAEIPVIYGTGTDYELPIKGSIFPHIVGQQFYETNSDQENVINLGAYAEGDILASAFDNHWYLGYIAPAAGYIKVAHHMFSDNIGTAAGSQNSTYKLYKVAASSRTEPSWGSATYSYAVNHSRRTDISSTSGGIVRSSTIGYSNFSFDAGDKIFLTITSPEADFVDNSGGAVGSSKGIHQLVFVFNETDIHD